MRLPATLVSLVIAIGSLLSCSKSGFLDKKPSTDLVVPTTLSDFQLLLDNTLVMGQTPVLGELSADNFYLAYSYWQVIGTRENNAYIWAKEIFGAQEQVDDWDTSYRQVLYANVVLAGLTKITVTEDNRQQWNAIKGAALFIRAYAFYNIAQLFAPPYDSTDPGTGWGIPLRLDPDVNIKSVRSSVHATYAQIVSDLQTAAAILPASVQSANLNRPSRPAALAMLARVYLSMRAYTQADSYADSCLQTYNTLLNYNKLSPTSIPTFPLQNPEVMYQTRFLDYTQVLVGIIYPYCMIDSALYSSYDSNDLRRKYYYRISPVTNLPMLSWAYSGTAFPFSGLATDEVFLIRAECAARVGNTTAALNDLNALLKMRWVSGQFHPVTAGSAQDALGIILTERRKELAFRGLRWADLRRLNKEGANITLSRQLNGQSYTLPPNSPNYVLPIPSNVKNLSGMVQNPRQ